MQLLADYEVDTVFGMAGTMTVEVYRGIGRAKIRHVQCRNEQGASLMADGYARATGKPGVCTLIAGPGVTNAATGIAQAFCDSQPMLVISGATATRSLGKGWGAIHCSELPAGQDVWVHFSVIEGVGYHALHAGDIVDFDYEPARQDSFTFRATRARRVAPGSAPTLRREGERVVIADDCTPDTPLTPRRR